MLGTAFKRAATAYCNLNIHSKAMAAAVASTAALGRPGAGQKGGQVGIVTTTPPLWVVVAAAADTHEQQRLAARQPQSTPIPAQAMLSRSSADWPRRSIWVKGRVLGDPDRPWTRRRVRQRRSLVTQHHAAVGQHRPCSEVVDQRIGQSRRARKSQHRPRLGRQLDELGTAHQHQALGTESGRRRSRARPPRRSIRRISRVPSSNSKTRVESVRRGRPGPAAGPRCPPRAGGPAAADCPPNCPSRSGSSSGPAGCWAPPRRHCPGRWPPAATPARR